VSSAGLDRVLRKESDFVRFAGERAQIKLRVGIQDDGPKATATSLPRKTFLGLLQGVEDGKVVIECDGWIYRLSLDNIDKARLSPVFD
jgi:ribosome maturation factor RimP